MTNAWRFTCARCGSHSVKRIQGAPQARSDAHSTGWRCRGKSDHSQTPAVWDKLRDTWFVDHPEENPSETYVEPTTSFKSWPGGGL